MVDDKDLNPGRGVMLSRRRSARVILLELDGNFLTRPADLSVNIRPATCIVSTRASYGKVFIVRTFDRGRASPDFPSLQQAAARRIILHHHQLSREPLGLHSLALLERDCITGD